ncbi:MAG: ligand-gated TonB-dependent outer rane channel, partial [Verrucomicrobiales bacterium]|nr:ligand-gated TonB-dependent outer rane channel [Verrucomicrobiales bacterium]
MSLKDLTEIPVISVNNSPQKLSSIPAAVSVLTQDEIRRSGATSIAEALRLVPGLDVARVDSHTWAISSRGFNDVFANKLLVMVDGRTVYTPLFSGVYWDVQDTVLEDIDQIEVVRGPGASRWGANAVDGVINIITKKTRDTQGLLISGGAGMEEHGFASIRYGFKIADDLHMRVYGKYLNMDDSFLSTGGQAMDGWDMARTGFRLDYEPKSGNEITLQGDAYAGRIGQIFTTPSFIFPYAANVQTRTDANGGNLLTRWTHTFSEDSVTKLQLFYDRTVRNTLVFNETRDTGDMDFQHDFTLGERNKLVWGAGYRRSSDEAENSAYVSLNPDHRTTDLFSAFIQDEIALMPQKIFATPGLKIEHNSFTGFEVQPSLRVQWNINNGHTLWGSVSRAVRSPSRAEDDLIINPPGAPPGFASILGTRNFESETVIACELGYRIQPSEKWTVDTAVYYNIYDDLRSLSAVTPLPITPYMAGNDLYGRSYGFELSTAYQVTPQWRISPGYSFSKIELHHRGGSREITEAGIEGSSPQNQLFVRSTWDVSKNVDFDTTFRYIDSLPGQGVPAYYTFDLRVGWRPCKNVEISIVGQNLIDDHHPEFYPTTISTQRTEVERS